MDEHKQYSEICKPKFDAIFEKMARKDDQNEIKANVKEMLALLQGNGIPGVFTRLALLEKENKDNKESGGSTHKWILGIVAAIIVFIAQALFMDWLATRNHLAQETKQIGK